MQFMHFILITALNDGYTIKLGHPLQKSIRIKHHYENYKESLTLKLNIIPSTLKIKKLPAISTSKHMIKREIWEKFTKFPFLKF